MPVPQQRFYQNGGLEVQVLCDALVGSGVNRGERGQVGGQAVRKEKKPEGRASGRLWKKRLPLPNTPAERGSVSEQ